MPRMAVAPRIYDDVKIWSEARLCEFTQNVTRLITDIYHVWLHHEVISIYL